ncbi:MAG: LptF/LptG family permease [Ferruginibacter sp.]
MKKIDSYILKKYLTTFFFCLLLLTTIVVVVDISEHTEDFVKANLNASQIITDYYFGFIPRIIAMLFPLFIFISVIFFTSKMAGRSEVIAILSSGVSFNRYMRPFLIGGFFMALLLWVGYQYIIPKANMKWADFSKEFIDVNLGARKVGTYRQNIYFKNGIHEWVGIKGYDSVSKSGNNLFIQKFENNKLISNLRAPNFQWDTTSNKWKLTNVIERKFDSLNQKVTYTDVQLSAFNFKPIDLRKDDYIKDQLTTPQLNKYIKSEINKGSGEVNSLLVERYNRDAIPFSVLVLTVIGTSLASRKVRGGSGIHLATGVILSVLYVLFSRLSVVFATQGNFSPLLAAWTPNIIFTIVALYLYSRASK